MILGRFVEKPLQERSRLTWTLQVVRVQNRQVEGRVDVLRFALEHTLEQLLGFEKARLVVLLALTPARSRQSQHGIRALWLDRKHCSNLLRGLVVDAGLQEHGPGVEARSRVFGIELARALEMLERDRVVALAQRDQTRGAFGDGR